MFFSGNMTIMQISFHSSWDQTQSRTKQCLETNARLPVPDLGEIQHSTCFEQCKQYQRPLRATRYVACCVILSLVAAATIAAEELSVGSPRDTVAPSVDGLIASPEPGWPQWRGPRRDGISDETGLLASWSDGGPELGGGVHDQPPNLHQDRRS